MACEYHTKDQQKLWELQSSENYKQQLRVVANALNLDHTSQLSSESDQKAGIVKKETAGPKRSH